MDDAHRAEADVDVSECDRKERAPGKQHVMPVERTYTAPRLEAGSPAPHAGEAVDVPADQVPQRVAAERVTRKQNHVYGHHERADADTEFARARRHGAIRQHAVHWPTRREKDVVGEDENENHRRVHGIAVQVLKNERKLGLTLVTVAWLADGAGHGIEEEGPVVGLAIVVAGGAKGAGKNQDQECGRERPPRRLEQGRVERREIRSPFVVAVDPGGPGCVDPEAAEDESADAYEDFSDDELLKELSERLG